MPALHFFELIALALDLGDVTGPGPPSDGPRPQALTPQTQDPALGDLSPWASGRLTTLERPMRTTLDATDDDLDRIGLMRALLRDEITAPDDDPFEGIEPDTERGPLDGIGMAPEAKPGVWRKPGTSFTGPNYYFDRDGRRVKTNGFRRFGRVG